MRLTSLLTPIASLELDEPAVTNPIGPPKCVRQRGFVQSQVFFFLPFPNAFYVLTATWIRELNPKDLGKSSIWRARVWGQFESLGFALTMLSLFEESAKKKKKTANKMLRAHKKILLRSPSLQVQVITVQRGHPSCHCYYMQFNPSPTPFYCPVS